ncbi:MAG: hypothetical protein OEY38_24050 [Gammaproteobacteria bacterium]|nr:hypothetical protein [Gammaproteobacteria bacterium]
MFHNLCLTLLVLAGLTFTTLCASAPAPTSTYESTPKFTQEVNFAGSLVTRQFFSAGAKQFIGMGLTQLFYGEMNREMKLQEPIKEGTYSDEDLKQFLNQFDQILTELLVPSEAWVASNEQAVHQVFLLDIDTQIRNSTYPDDELVRFLQNKEVQNWAMRQSAFLAEAAPLGTFVQLIKLLAPEKKDHEEFAERKKVLQAFESSSVLNALGKYTVIHLHNISQALSSDLFKPLMPTRYNLEKLHQEEISLRADAERIFGNPSTINYAKLIGASLVVNKLTTDDKMKVYHFQQQELGAIDELVKRAYYAVYPKLAGNCDRFRQWYDEESIRNSNGDWTKVKYPDGRSIDPQDIIDEVGDSVMQPLTLAYLHGCFGEKDVVAARQVLESWANTHGDRGPIAHLTHCTLANWARYGVGGEKDESTALKWEARFVHETKFAKGCMNHLPPIDPSNPWRVLK